MLDRKMTKLREKMLMFTDLKESDLEEVFSLFSVQKVASGDKLFKEGDKVDNIFFINKGIITYVSFVDDNDTVIEFYEEGEFHTDANSYLKGLPAVCSAIAEEDTELFKANKNELELLFNQSLDLQKLGRKMMEHSLLTIIKRNYEKQIYKNEERYALFVDKRYDLSQRVPQYKIASYLNITAVGLSKIRRRMYDRSK